MGTVPRDRASFDNALTSAHYDLGGELAVLWVRWCWKDSPASKRAIELLDLCVIRCACSVS